MKVACSNSNFKPAKTQHFTSLHGEMSFADDIMRRANNLYPRVSPLYFNEFKNAPKKQESILKANFKLNLFRKKSEKLKFLSEDIGQKELSGILADEYIKNILDLIKKIKLGNCGESSALGKIALVVNGIDDVKKVQLNGFLRKNIAMPLDYSLDIVHLSKDADLRDYRTFGKDAYIVDPWAKFVKRVPDAINYYKNDYKKPEFFQIFRTIGIKTNDFEVSSQMIKYLNKVAPELKIK